jgi:hypothetical protein
MDLNGGHGPALSIKTIQRHYRINASYKPRQSASPVPSTSTPILNRDSNTCTSSSRDEYQNVSEAKKPNPHVEVRKEDDLPAVEGLTLDSNNQPPHRKLNFFLSSSFL